MRATRELNVALILPGGKTSKPIYTGEVLSFSKYDRAALRRLVERIDRPSKRILEVGSWLGTGSTTTIIDTLHGEANAALYCVDTWRGSVNVERHQQMVAQYDVFNTFMHNVRKANGEHIVKPLMMTSLDAAAVIADESFDLIFIDAEHSYSETSKDIGAWMPKVRKGGILCGHDCEMRAEVVGLDRLRQNLSVDAIDGNQFFLCLHPGVILATYEHFQNRHHVWGEELIVADDGETGRATLWDIVC